MNKAPIDSKYFDEYIQRNALFEKAQKSLKAYLENWYKASPDSFIDDMRAPFEKVITEVLMFASIQCFLIFLLR